jgi:hypothetical protein
MEVMTMTNREMKSKAVSLGNRLAANMPRTKAFVKAWNIVKIGAVEIRVAGVTFGNRQEALRRLSKYQPSQVRTFLAPEPENPVDSNAIAVMTGVQGGKGLYRLGYVPKEMINIVRAINNRTINLHVVSGSWNHRGQDWQTFGTRVSLAV